MLDLDAVVAQHSLAELIALRDGINLRIKERSYRGRLRGTRYGWERLRVGQEMEIIGTRRERATARQAAHVFGRDHCLRFVTRSVGNAIYVRRVE